jgi:hypothetical protein
MPQLLSYVSLNTVSLFSKKKQQMLDWVYYGLVSNAFIAQVIVIRWLGSSVAQCCVFLFVCLSVCRSVHTLWYLFMCQSTLL